MKKSDFPAGFPNNGQKCAQWIKKQRACYMLSEKKYHVSKLMDLWRQDFPEFEGLPQQNKHEAERIIRYTAEAVAAINSPRVLAGRTQLLVRVDPQVFAETTLLCSDCNASHVISTAPESGTLFTVAGHLLRAGDTQGYLSDEVDVVCFAVCAECLQARKGDFDFLEDE